jgi:hypothetical protein
MRAERRRLISTDIVKGTYLDQFPDPDKTLHGNISFRTVHARYSTYLKRELAASSFAMWIMQAAWSAELNQRAAPQVARDVTEPADFHGVHESAPLRIRIRDAFHRPLEMRIWLRVSLSTSSDLDECIVRLLGRFGVVGPKALRV